MVLAGMGQINITPARQSAESSNETGAAEVQTNAPPNELELYLGHTSAWTFAGLEEVLQQLPGHEDTWRPAESTSGVPLIQAQSNSPEGLPNNGAGESGPRSADDGAGSASEQDAGTQRTGREAESISMVTGTIENVSVDPSGRPLVYTDLSRLRREQSFVNFTDQRVGRATTLNAPNPGNIRNLRPGDSWAILPVPETEESGVQIENNEEVSPYFPEVSSLLLHCQAILGAFYFSCLVAFGKFSYESTRKKKYANSDLWVYRKTGVQ